MKIKVMEPLKDYENKPLKRGNELYTVRQAISESVNSQRKDQPPMTAEDKARVYQISIKVWGNSEVNLTVETEIPFILKRAGEIQSALIYGRLVDLFEKPEGEKKD